MKKWIRLMAWLAVILVVMLCLNPVFMPKWTQDIASTLVHNGFYDEEEDSLDVMYFGSSQVACSISPMRIYEKTGIKSYSCATGSQSIVCSYYWMKEAVKYQKPKVVVFDTLMAVEESILDDGANRNALDYMHFSSNKMQAILAVDQVYDFDSTPASYMLPILRYHDRWKELSKEDVSYIFSDKHFVRKGYCPQSGIYVRPGGTYQGISVDLEVPEREITDYQREYLQKIIDFCEEEEIALVLIKTPMVAYTQESYNVIEKIARENQVPYIDMNITDVWQAAGMDYQTDFQGAQHLNINGADKVSDYLGEFLLENYPALAEQVEKAPTSAQWEEDLKEYQDLVRPIREEMEAQITAGSQSASSP